PGSRAVLREADERQDHRDQIEPRDLPVASAGSRASDSRGGRGILTMDSRTLPLTNQGNTPMTATMTSIVSPNVDRRIAEFLDALNSSGGKPREQLTRRDARAGRAILRQGLPFPPPPADVSEKTITVDGQPLTLTIVRPA